MRGCREVLSEAVLAIDAFRWRKRSMTIMSTRTSTMNQHNHRWPYYRHAPRFEQTGARAEGLAGK